ncbi:hypothetical protein BBJ28_00020602 [Nothophytophthora sp. Chile5]|nr:hypothetical protein BBJ28_00020602 [Nothophytophthora sp. Chile5]
MDENRKRVLALAEQGDWAEVLELVETNPALAQAQDDFGMLPLHWACTEAAIELDMLTRLIQAFPQACQLENLSGMLPLHVAIKAKAPGLLINALLNVYPQAALAKDGSGRYPVDLAMATNLPNYTLDLIRKAGARAVRSASTSSLHQRSASMDDLTSVDSSDSSVANQSDDEDKSALIKAQSIGSLMSSRQASAYGKLLDEKLPMGSPNGSVDSTMISLQLKELLSQLHQLSVDIRMNKTSSSGSSTYRSSFSSTFSSSGNHGGEALTSVLWNPSDRFGVVLEPAAKEVGARIKGFSSRSDVLGVESLTIGDVLVNINGASVVGASFPSIMRFLKHSKVTCKLRFCKSSTDPSGLGKCSSTSSNPAADHDTMMYSKVATMLEATLKKVSAVEETVRLTSAMSFCT